MGFPIPEPYCWDETFCTFYAQIDDQHKGLFDGIFKCAANRGDSAALSSLAALVSAHFVDEEGIMANAKYGGLTEHKGIHAGFVSKLAGLSCPLSDETIDFAKDWLVQHIKGVDFKYKGKLD